jgi:hypothetical protein
MTQPNGCRSDRSSRQQDGMGDDPEPSSSGGQRSARWGIGSRVRGGGLVRHNLFGVDRAIVVWTLS